MTVLAAFRDKTGFAIGADSGAFDEGNHLKMTIADAKVWAAGDTLQGGCGNGRVIDIARSAAIPDPYKLMAVLLEANIADGWSVLVVSAKAIYELGDDGSVFRFREPYCAAGAGGPIALGALAVLSNAEGSPRGKVKAALDVCNKHSLLCSPPIVILSK